MDGDKLVCDQTAMMSMYLMLVAVVVELQEAELNLEALRDKLDEVYQGEAKQEMEIFFASFPIHINRLSLFYSKLAEYVYVTAQSFMENDIAMSENMEKE